jgi:hypothetical protein
MGIWHVIFLSMTITEREMPGHVRAILRDMAREILQLPMNVGARASPSWSGGRRPDHGSGRRL